MGYAFLKVIGEAANANYFRSLVKDGDEDSAVLKVWIKVKLTDVGAQITNGYYYTPGYLLWPLYEFQVAASEDDADNLNRSLWSKAQLQVEGSVDDADDLTNLITAWDTISASNNDADDR